MARSVPDFACDFVGSDNDASGRMLVRHLLDLGVRSAAFVGGVQGASIREDRLAGVRKGLAEERVELTAEVALPYEARKDFDGLLTSVLNQSGLPDAIVAYNDVAAFGVVGGLRARGIDPGKDVALASFDNVPGAAEHYPGITSADAFPQRVGRLATQLLLSTFVEGPHPFEKVLMAPLIEKRASTMKWAGVVAPADAI